VLSTGDLQRFTNSRARPDEATRPGSLLLHDAILARAAALSLCGMLSPGRVSVHSLLKGQRPPHSMRTVQIPRPKTDAEDQCKKFADKYIEHDFVVLFIDIILIKPQVYRHLLYNRLGTADDRLNVSNTAA